MMISLPHTGTFMEIHFEWRFGMADSADPRSIAAHLAAALTANTFPYRKR